MIKQVLEFYFTLGVPLLYGLCLLAITQGNSVSFQPSLRLVGIGLALAGLLLWGLSYLHLKNSFGVLPRRQTKISTGVYAHLKHPMYTGIMATFLGLGVANQSQAGLTVTLLVLLPVLIIRAKLEERQLV